VKYLALIVFAIPLTGCGVTQWQRDQDSAAADAKFLKMATEAYIDLHSPEMEQRIREAQAYPQK